MQFATRLNAPSASKHFLKQKKGGIIYVGLASFDDSSDIALAVDGVEPTMENFLNTAPSVVRYYLTYSRKNPQTVQPFIDFIFSPEGEAIINKRILAAKHLP